MGVFVGAIWDLIAHGFDTLVDWWYEWNRIARWIVVITVAALVALAGIWIFGGPIGSAMFTLLFLAGGIIALAIFLPPLLPVIVALFQDGRVALRVVVGCLAVVLLGAVYFAVVPVGFNGETRAMGVTVLLIAVAAIALRLARMMGLLRFLLWVLVAVFTAVIFWQAHAPAPIAYSAQRSRERSDVRTSTRITQDEGLIPSVVKSGREFLWGKPKPQPVIQTAPAVTPVAIQAPPAPAVAPAPKKKAKVRPAAVQTPPSAPTPVVQQPVTEAAVTPIKRTSVVDLPTMAEYVTGDNFLFQLKQVKLKGTSLVIDLAVTNQKSGVSTFYLGDWGNVAKLFDDRGESFTSTAGTTMGKEDGAWMELYPGIAVPVRIFFTVSEETRGVRELTIYSAADLWDADEYPAVFRDLAL